MKCILRFAAGALGLVCAHYATPEALSAEKCKKYGDLFVAVSASGKMEFFKSLEACEAHNTVVGSAVTTAAPAVKSGASSGGADNGTDPSVFAKRVIFYNDYNHFAGKVNVNVAYLDLFYPMFKDNNGVERMLFRVEAPFINASGLGSLLAPPESASFPKNVSGIGDFQFRFFSLPWYNSSQTLKLITGFDLYVPSAQGDLIANQATNAITAVSLGTGLYRIEPTIALVWKPKPNILIAPAYEQDISFAGDRSRLPINVGKLKIFGMYAWPTGTYVLPELQIVHSYIHYNLMQVDGIALAPGTRLNTEVFFRPEIGQVLNKDGTTVYIKPGVGLNNPGNLNREWGLEAGLRMTF